MAIESITLPGNTTETDSIADLIRSTSSTVAPDSSNPTTSNGDVDGTEEGTTGEQELEGQEQEASQPAPAAVEVVSFTDDSGQKKQYKIDWNNKEQIKKHISLALGARKWQVERDSARKELENLKPAYEDINKSWSAVEQAFQSNGIQGIVNLLAGKEGAYEEHIENVVQQRQLRANASPSQLRELELQERIERMERDSARREHLSKANADRAAKEREAADLARTESLVHPAFNKYRFAGSLGDPVLETQLDSAIWTQALSKLEEISATGAELTANQYEKAFKDVAATFNKAITRKANEKATQVVTKRKEQAQTQVSARAVAGLRGTQPDMTQFEQDLDNGSVGNALKALFSGRVKL